MSDNGARVVAHADSGARFEELCMWLWDRGYVVAGGAVGDIRTRAITYGDAVFGLGVRVTDDARRAAAARGVRIVSARTLADLAFLA